MDTIIHKHKEEKSDWGDRRFSLIKAFPFVVPSYHNEKEDNVQPLIAKRIGCNYKHAYSLKPGIIVNLSFYKLRNWPSLEDCLSFSERKGGLLLGVEGIFLISTEVVEDVPRDIVLISLAEKEKMWGEAERRYRVPAIYKSSQKLVGTAIFGCIADGPISEGHTLMVFTIESPPSIVIR